MWSFTSWREGEIEKDPELRAARALEELEGWPEDVRGCNSSSSSNFFILVVRNRLPTALAIVL